MFEGLKSSAELHLQKTYGLKEVAVLWKRPQEASHGDIATPVALSLSKELKKAPQEIAKDLAEALSKDTSVEKAEVAGPGYVNVWLKPEALLKELNKTREACSPKKADTKKKPVIIEYSQPNIAKPLGIHHILSTVIGQSLRNLHDHLGIPAVSINHIGDYGTQFGKLAVAFEKWGTKPLQECSLDDLLEVYVKFHDEAEKDATLEDEGREAFKKLEEGDAELTSFWKTVIEITMKEMEEIYERLHIHFDFTHGESFYQDKMQPIIEEGKKKKVFKEGEKGALIAEFPEESKLPPAIILKADGATIYLTRDLATIKYRMETWHPDSILYVVDVAQSLYFQQLFAVVGQLKWDLPHLEHIVFGRMSFPEKKMSTRKGNILRLREVLDEGKDRAMEMIKQHGDAIQTENEEELAEMMGTGALVYGVLSQNRKMNMIFDWEKTLSLEGNSAPYLQYTHARAKSVLRKAEDDGSKIPEKAASLSEKERILINTLLRFEEVLQETLESKMPHVLGQYIYGLSQDFNAFYNADPILNAEPEARALRLSLTSLVASVIQTGAHILTFRVPERM